MALFLAVFSLALLLAVLRGSINRAGQEHFNFHLLSLSGPCDCYPVGVLYVFDLKGEVFP
jgi:hypothetical protein